MITLSPRALTELKELVQAQDGASALRVWVAGGGCSGLSYGMALDDGQPEEGDNIFEQEGIKVYVDALSLGYMAKPLLPVGADAEAAAAESRKSNSLNGPLDLFSGGHFI